MDAYTERHLDIRKYMLQKKDPHEDDEATTIFFMTRKLAKRRNMAQHIPLLITSLPKTINESRTLLNILVKTTRATNTHTFPDTAAQNIKWCEFHRAYRTHETAACQAMRSAQEAEQLAMNYQPSYD